jgi:hypothetical protein
LFPASFDNVVALDVGALDINGNNRGLFTHSEYLGIDIVDGPNVDIQGYLHEYAQTCPRESYDTIVSTDALEHDKFWRETLAAMTVLLKPAGLLVWTAAGAGRDEHGTYRCNPAASPGTLNYYGNITPQMVREQAYVPEYIFKMWEFNESTNTLGPGLDTRFWGIKTNWREEM